MPLSLSLGLGLSSRNTGVGGPFPAPSGYRWTLMVVNGEPQAVNGETLVLLERAA